MLGALLVGAVAMTAWSAPDADAGLPATAFVGMRVIDGTGAAPRDNMVVVVRGARISALGHRSDIDVPTGASVIDATGQVLMPGLVDLHCHYGGGRDGLANAFGVQLRFGVTTVRSLGADGGNNLTAIAEAESGAFPAPRIYTAGIGFTAPGGLPPGLPGMHRPTSEAQAREMVRAHAERDVDLVKIWVDPTLDGSLAMGPLPRIAPEIRAAIVDEARKHGLPVVAHIYEEADARQLVAAGVRHFVHAVRAQDMDPSFVQLARDNDLTFAPALSKAQDAWFFAEHSEALDDPAWPSCPAPPRRSRVCAPSKCATACWATISCHSFAACTSERSASSTRCRMRVSRLASARIAAPVWSRTAGARTTRCVCWWTLA